MSTAAEAPDTTPGRRRRFTRIVAVLLVLAGVLALVYPVVATNVNNQRHEEFARRYEAQVRQTPSARLAESLRRAREYNRTLDGVPILDPWLMKVTGDPSGGPYRTYLGQLADTDAMARLRVPSVGIDLPVRHGTGDDALSTGVGHLYGTSLPVGGIGTHSVLTSHTGMSDATLFDHLDDVAEGDVFFVDVAGETLAYRVNSITVRLPTQIDDLKPVAGHDYLTLFTCTPYAVNTHRLLVRGERIPYTADVARAHDAATGRGFAFETWMWWMLAGAAVGLGVIVLIVVGEVRRKRRATTDATLTAEE